MSETKIDEDYLYTWLGSEIRKKRTKQKLSQTKLAHAVGVTRTSITNIESGIQKLPISLLFEICTELKIEPKEIIPSLNEVMKVMSTEGLEEVVIDKESEMSSRVPPRTAKAMHDILNSIEDENGN